MSPELTKLIIDCLFSTALIGFGRLIYDYQTLIAGAAALGAAFVATRPVYRQLALMQTQTNTMYRAELLNRQTEIEQAIAAVNENVDQKLNELSREFQYDEFGHQTLLNDHQAHNYDQSIGVASSWLEYKYRWRDSVDAETARMSLLASTESLSHLLHEIYCHNMIDVDDPEAGITQADYDELVARGEVAKTEIHSALDVCDAQLSAFIITLRSEIELIEGKLKDLDKMLLAPRS